jgi:hypothetical protein
MSHQDVGEPGGNPAHPEGTSSFTDNVADSPDEHIEDAERTPAEPGAETPEPVPFDGGFASLLEDVGKYFRRYVVVSDIQLAAIALWVAHTHVCDQFRATPYLNFWSPEPGSAKTLAMEILEPVVREGFVADDLTGASLFRFVDKEKPTLFFDEVDGVFNRKGDNNGSEDIRKILNSGYRQGKRVLRMGGHNNTEVQVFDPFCPKALAGLNELPPTLAHRSIPIAMKPPLPTERYEDDYDFEDVQLQAAGINAQLQAWAESEPPLTSKERRPNPLPELDARRNEIWRPLFRIADLAGGRWPQVAREAALALSSGAAADDEKSYGLRLLADIRIAFLDDRMFASELVKELNSFEESPWGGFNLGEGMTTREMGWRLKHYGIKANTIRKGELHRGKGYHRDQFMEAWARYFPPEKGDKGDTPLIEPEMGDLERVTDEDCHPSSNPEKRDEQSDVTLVTLSEPGYGEAALNGNGKVRKRPEDLTEGEIDNLLFDELPMGLYPKRHELMTPEEQRQRAWLRLAAPGVASEV